MIGAQILYNKLASICTEMGHNLQRIARSPLLAQDRAFATGLMTGELELAVQVQHNPDHLYALRESTRHLFDYFTFDVSDGDVLIVADPYHGGTQAQVLTMAAPCFHEGELVMFPVVRAQLTDMAGEYPGGLNPHAFEIWQESLRLSPIKLYKGGTLQQDVWRFLLAHSRTPELLDADLKAMIACCKMAQEQIHRVLSVYSAKQVRQSLDEMFAYSERRVLSHLASFGVKHATGASKIQVDGKLSEIRISLLVENDKAVLDFQGTDAQLNAPYNLTPTAAKAYAVWPLLGSIADDLAINDGTLAPFVLKAPEGTLVKPRFPAATALGGFLTGHFIAKAVTSALRNAGVAEDVCPFIHGPGPQAVLFEPVGTSPTIQPLFLVPGFPMVKHQWGPPALYGDRQLVSAEELEVQAGFRMLERELDVQEGIRVRIANQQREVEANLFVPEGENGEYGFIELLGNKRMTVRKSVSSVRFVQGDEIVFSYSGKEGTSHE